MRRILFAAMMAAAVASCCAAAVAAETSPAKTATAAAAANETRVPLETLRSRIVEQQDPEAMLAAARQKETELVPELKAVMLTGSKTALEALVELHTPEALRAVEYAATAARGLPSWRGFCCR